MKSRLFRCWLVALLTLGTAHAAFAEIRVATSLEWLSCSAEAIVIGKISNLTTERGPGDVTYEDCVVAVEQVLKGDPNARQIAFTLRRIGASPTARPLTKSREGVLLFLSKSKDHGLERRLDDRWVPTIHYETPSIIDLSMPLEDIYSKEMKIVTDKEELLKIVREWAKSPVKQSLRWELPYGSPLFRKLYGGSACYLIVPAEEKFREILLALAHSAKPYERETAARELWKFPGDETEAMGTICSGSGWPCEYVCN